AARRVRSLPGGNPPLRLAAQRPAAVPNQWVVKFAPGTSQVARAQLHAMAGAELVSTVPELGVQTVQLPGNQAAAVYARSRNVLWLEPNRLRYPLALNPPNDPAYNDVDTNLPSDPANGTWYQWDAHLTGCVDGWSIWPGHYFTAADRANPGVRIAV